MLTYSALVMAYLAYVGIRGEWAGPLLWPAVVVHAVLTVLLARAWFRRARTGNRSHKGIETTLKKLEGQVAKQLQLGLDPDAESPMDY